MAEVHGVEPSPQPRALAFETSRVTRRGYLQRLGVALQAINPVAMTATPWGSKRSATERCIDTVMGRTPRERKDRESDPVGCHTRRTSNALAPMGHPSKIVVVSSAHYLTVDQDRPAMIAEIVLYATPKSEATARSVSPAPTLFRIARTSSAHKIRLPLASPAGR